MKHPKSLTSLAILVAMASTPSLTATATPYKPDANIERSKVPDSAKWNLSHLIPNDEVWQAGFKQTAQDRKDLAAFQGKLSNPSSLKECLDLYFRARVFVRKQSLYANLQHKTATKSLELQAKMDRGQAEISEFMAASSFIRQEIMAIDDAAMAEAFKKEPKLEQYRTYLEGMRRRRSRVLSSEGERIMGLVGDHLWAEIDLNEIPSPHEKVFNAIRSDAALPHIVDEQGKSVQLTFSNFGMYRASSERSVRKEAVAKFFGNLKGSQNTYASALGGEMGFHVLLAKARGYDSALEAYMDKDNLPISVYKALIESINANLGSLHRYVALRKRLLNLPDVHYYDLYIPMVKATRLDIPYEEGTKNIQAALAPLGPAYGKKVAEAMDPKNGWMDVYPHKDKESGAFSVMAYGAHPYVMLNYFNSYNDMSTFSHEFGHAMQQYMSMSKQPISTSDMSLTLSEIPSTFHEKLLSDYMLSKAKNDDERLYILTQKVESIRTTIFRQAMFAEFELALCTAAEKGESLTAESINNKYKEMVQRYYGKDYVMDPGDEMEWAMIPHFYYKFYTYAYALGLSSGIALAEKVQSGDPKAREAYLQFLEAGCSRSPVEIAKSAGVDLTKADLIDAAAKLMDKCIAEIEKIVGKK